jgi:16S rRNA processing protein RimM
VHGEPARITVSRRVGGGRRAIKLDRPVERGAELSVPRDELGPLPADSYYVADLVGLEVLDETGAVVGVVRDVHPGPANDALELDSGLLLPLVEDCVREVDLEGGRVHLNPGFTD